MKIRELVEAPVYYQTQSGVQRFRVSGPTTFEQLKAHPTIAKYAGPNTVVIDVTTEPDVMRAPGENKWNAIARLFGQDNDEIVCARGFTDEWLCAAINVEI